MFKCASSIGMKHFLKEPVGILCGHYMCKECINKNKVEKCGKCGKYINYDAFDTLISLPESEFVNEMINLTIDQLFVILQKDFGELLVKLKGEI